jgi:hypothetical protein
MRLTGWMLVAATVLLCGCAETGQLDVEPAPDDAVVYVIERGWHSDIGLPVTAIAGPLETLERDFPGVRYMTFGFGERQFLLDRRTSVGSMLRALLPSKSALLMTALRATPQDAFGPEHVVTLHVSRSGLQQIVDAIWRELETSSTGQPPVLAEGPYPGSVFYGARETYDGLFTCNTWVATTLRAGGLPMPTASVLFVGQVMGMARWISASQISPRGRGHDDGGAMRRRGIAAAERKTPAQDERK